LPDKAFEGARYRVRQLLRNKIQSGGARSSREKPRNSGATSNWARASRLPGLTFVRCNHFETGLGGEIQNAARAIDSGLKGIVPEAPLRFAEPQKFTKEIERSKKA